MPNWSSDIPGILQLGSWFLLNTQNNCVGSTHPDCCVAFPHSLQSILHLKQMAVGWEHCNCSIISGHCFPFLSSTWTKRIPKTLMSPRQHPTKKGKHKKLNKWKTNYSAEWIINATYQKFNITCLQKAPWETWGRQDYIRDSKKKQETAVNATSQELKKCTITS